MTTAHRTPDLAIVGAGVIGLAVAWRASLAGLQVIVLERDRPGAATSAVAAGMIAPIFEAEPREPELLSLMQASAAMYPEFAAELTDASGMTLDYRRLGTLAVARDRDEAEALERELMLRRSLGLGVERLRPSSARELEPALAPTIRGALEIHDDHAIDPRRLTAALAVAAGRAGARIESGAEVQRLEPSGSGERVAGVRLITGELVRAGCVLIAAGPWSASIPVVGAEAAVPVHPIKGQTVRLRDGTGPGLISRVIRMASGYLVPREDGRYVLGATMEERGFDATPTAGAVYELLRDATELIPGVSELVIEELAVGLRPGTPDNRPIIGAGAVPGLHWATGHHRHGILLTPVTAELALAALTGREDERAAPFSPARFAAVAAVPAGGPA